MALVGNEELPHPLPSLPRRNKGQIAPTDFFNLTLQFIPHFGRYSNLVIGSCQGVRDPPGFGMWKPGAFPDMHTNTSVNWGALVHTGEPLQMPTGKQTRCNTYFGV